MNILFISHISGRGGAETVLLDVIRIVASNQSNNIFIALPNDGNDAFEKALGDLLPKFKIKRFFFRSVRNSLPLLIRNLGYGILLGLPKLVRYINHNNIDLVYVNSSVNIIGVMAARISGCKYICHIHEQSTKNYRWAPKWFNKFYKKWLLDKRCKSIFVSNTSYQLWLKDLDILQIPNSLVLYSPFKQIDLIKNNKVISYTFGYIGSLTTNKNVARLIESFNALHSEYRLLIAGVGEIEVELRKLSKHNTKIEFIGYVDNLNEFYAQIDCLVIPSLNESWGLVGLEAMSAGVPVIMTKNTGLTELFDSGTECIFVEPTSIKQICSAMRKVSENRDYAKSMTVLASKKLEKLDINNYFEKKILALINEYKA